MTADQLRKEIERRGAHVTFSYQGKDCGVDPLGKNCFDLWCGDALYQAESLEEAMRVPLINGKTLEEIAEELTDIE